MWGSLRLAPNNNYPELSFLCEGPLSIHVICILLTQLSIVLHSAFIIKSIGRGIGSINLSFLMLYITCSRPLPQRY